MAVVLTGTSGLLVRVKLVLLAGTSGLLVRVKLADVASPDVPVVTNVPDIVFALTDT